MKCSFASAALGWFRRPARAAPATRAAIPATALDGLPEDLRLYAIGDVHGCADLLADLHHQIDRREAQRDTPGRVVEVLLGDVIDRGPDSRGVIDMLIRRSARHVVVVLRGNHEQIMLDALRDPQRLPFWLRLGGLETLRSYGVSPVVPLEGDNLAETVRRAHDAIPRNHLDFLAELPVVFRCRDVTFAHAGLRPGVPLDRQDYTDMMTIREPFLSFAEAFETYVVHGHTRTARVDIRANRANIDTGAYATGRLSGLLIERGRFELMEALAPGVSPSAS